MKAINTHKCEATLFLIVLLYVGNIANAQIKVVGDDYSQSLSAKDYYSQDVGFETYFPHVDPKVYFGYMSINPETTISLIGDTVWLGVPNGGNNGDPWTFAACKGKLLDTIPSGYYVISGYIFGWENANDIFHIKAENSDWHSFPRGRIGYTESLKHTILDNPTPDEMDRRKIVDKYLAYMKLTSIDTTEDIIEAYYIPSDLDEHGTYYFRPYHNLISLRFYNEIKNGLLNKDVILVSTRGDLKDRTVNILIEDYMNMKYQIEDVVQNGEIIEDDMTSLSVQLQDSIFVVKDIVMKVYGRGDFHDPLKIGMYCILYGEKTGSFARKVQYSSYKYYYSATAHGKYYSGTSQFNNMPFTSKRGWDGHLSIVPIESLQKAASIFADSIATRVKIDAMNSAEQERIRKKNELYWKQLKEQEASKHHEKMVTKYGAKYGELVTKKQVAIGMTKEMCSDAWGRPLNTYRTTTTFGQSEVWCYNYKTRIYFYNGKVVQIDN